ncbi:class I SAM-dependent methyltransferase [Hyphococcus sp.]|uniref:class I SAM-dependent methyltransferase n=1 Tax=Hyphococcus sp. TaxID=2038636 RepID=UPI00208389EC|nr:MAG: hypothetical protein DHS20C04_31720 [Marinicaulis sp.]
MTVKNCDQPDEAARWNGAAGQAWIDNQTMLDQLFKPFEDMLVDAVKNSAAETVLDIGCGTGATTLAMANALGGKGHCTGVDISQPMIAAAQARAKQSGATASFLCADAQDYPFEARSFDAITSRFGVMFFRDFVAAFSNVRSAANDGARLTFISWRSPLENEFMTTAERAARPLLPDLAPRAPGAPGQFAFADEDYVRDVLSKSGWRNVTATPVDVPSTLPESQLIPYLSRMGPEGVAIQNADDEMRSRLLDTVRAAFEPYVHGSEVRFSCACWVFRASAD